MRLTDELFPKGRTNNNKVKGNVNERSLCKALTDWSGIRFIRVPMSGGFRVIDHPAFIGDVVTGEGEPFPFVIETKHLKRFEIKETLRSNSKVATIWKQALSDSIRAKRMPCLFIRFNGMPSREWFFVVDAATAGTICAEFPIMEVIGKYNGEYCLTVFSTAQLFLLNFSKFLEVSKNLLSLHYEQQR